MFTFALFLLGFVVSAVAVRYAIIAAHRFGVVDGDARPLAADWRRALDHLPEAWREFYEERAALIEYDGGEPRATAERRAFECVLALAGELLLGTFYDGAGENRAAVT